MIKRALLVLLLSLGAIGVSTELLQTLRQGPATGTPQLRTTATQEVEEILATEAAPNSATVLTGSENTIEEIDMNDSDSAASAIEPEELTGLTLFDFGGAEPRWFTVNDDVMGGVSGRRGTAAVDIHRQPVAGKQWRLCLGALAVDLL
jgi:hypothetical protein